MKTEEMQSRRDPAYEVVWPLGRSTVRPPKKLSSSIPDLNGKTIGELWDWGFRGDEMFPIIRERLKQRFPDVRFVDFHTFGSTQGHNEAEVIAALPALLRQHGCDAVISGVGA